ncbi:SLOG family protein [Virgibacillus sp. FSP13]
MKVLTVTGYKPMELNIFKEDDHRISFIKAAIEKRLISFIEDGLEWVLLSGQMGVEMWTGQVVLDLKETYDIKLALIPPFENQATRWPEPIQQAYQELTLTADFYKPLYVGDYKGAFQFKAKNKWLINKSDGCLILMDEEFPGSGRFLYQEATESNNYSIYLITPADLDDIVEELRMADPDYWT